MRYCFPPDLARAFNCSRDDVHNLLKLSFDDEGPPDRKNALALNETRARLLGVAIELRKIGVAPKSIRIAVGQIENRIGKNNTHWLVLNSGGFAEILPRVM